MTQPGIESWPSGQLVNILTIMAMGQSLYISKVGNHSQRWPKGPPFSIATLFPELLHFTLDPYLIILSVKQGGIKYHFLSLWYDSIWDWTQVFWAIDKYSNHYANVQWWKICRFTYSCIYFHFYFLYFLNCLNVEKLKKRLVWRNPLNKEGNITTKPFLSVWFIHLSTYFHLVRFTSFQCSKVFLINSTSYPFWWYIIPLEITIFFN